MTEVVSYEESSQSSNGSSNGSSDGSSSEFSKEFSSDDPRTPEPAENAAQETTQAAGQAAGQERRQTDAITVSGLKGKITVADEVVEKVTALAALEVPGVADLGGDFARAFEAVRDRIGIGGKRATQGVKAEIQDGLVAIDVTIVITYGHVVMEVAAEVQSNVATSVARMLGMEVVEVNVVVDDVRLPGEGPKKA